MQVDESVREYLGPLSADEVVAKVTGSPVACTLFTAEWVQEPLGLTGYRCDGGNGQCTVHKRDPTGFFDCELTEVPDGVRWYIRYLRE